MVVTKLFLHFLGYQITNFTHLTKRGNEKCSVYMLMFQVPLRHTVSFDRFLSGLVWILNLEFWLTKTFDILPEIILEYLFQPNVSTAYFSARRACSDVYLEINTEGKMAAWRLRWPRRRQQEANNFFFLSCSSRQRRWHWHLWLASYRILLDHHYRHSAIFPLRLFPRNFNLMFLQHL